MIKTCIISSFMVSETLIYRIENYSLFVKFEILIYYTNKVTRTFVTFHKSVLLNFSKHPSMYATCT